MEDRALEWVIGFVTGAVPSTEFRDRLYAEPEAFESLLADGNELPIDGYVRGETESTFHYLLMRDWDDPAQVWDGHSACRDFLVRRGIEHAATEQYGSLHALMPGVQPEWIDAPMKWINDEMILEAPPGLEEDELKEWMRAQFAERFRCERGEPPIWIQSPAWPIREGEPLVFLGQLDVEDHLHDRGAVYVFLDPGTGHVETVVQTY